MLVEVHPAETVAGIIIAVHGEVDLATVPQLSRAFDLALDTSAAVIVDLCGCTFIDVAGVRAILRLKDAAKELVYLIGSQFLVDANAHGSLE